MQRNKLQVLPVCEMYKVEWRCVRVAPGVGQVGLEDEDIADLRIPNPGLTEWAGLSVKVAI